MPAKQRGSVQKLPSGRWSIQYYDEHGLRRRGGRAWETRTEARDALERKIDDVEKLRAGEPVVTAKDMPTLAELIAEHAAQHVAEANTKRTLAARLKYWTDEFGDVRIDRLDTRAIAAKRARLPEGSAWHIHKALRQVLSYAVRMKLLADNVAVDVENPKPKRAEIPTFRTWNEVDKLCKELTAARDRAIVVLAVGTGLRPEEWIALERGDVDRQAGVLHVRRVYVDGRLSEYGKTEKARRRVPLRARVLDALDQLPPRLDTRVLFPGERSTYVNLAAWRRNRWNPAVEAAGLDTDEDGNDLKRTPYAMRHTYATWAIAAGLNLFTLARRMGTSLKQIDETYGHLLPDAEEYERNLLDAYDAREAKAADQAGE